MKRKTYALASAAVVAMTMATVTGGCTGDPVVAVAPEQNVELEAPKPVAGGTLLVLKERGLAVVADTDLDQIVLVDLKDMSVAHTLALNPGDEPGRVVQGPDSTVFVALRRSGEVLAYDVDSHDSSRRAVCAAPRGMAYDAAAEQLHVACAGGELVMLSGDLQGPPLRTLQLDNDLRDVALVNGKVLVNRFRAADVFVVEPDGSVSANAKPKRLTGIGSTSRQFDPAVAWKMGALPGGEVLMLHQRGLVGEIPTGPPGSSPGNPTGQPYYGGDCLNGILHAAVSFFDSEGNNTNPVDTGGIGSIVLPVDFAVSPNNEAIAVVGAGNDVLFVTTLNRARSTDLLLISCGPGVEDIQVTVPGEPMAVAYSHSNASVYVQTRQPAQLRHILLTTGEELEAVDMPGPGRRHWGHALFHKAASPTATLSCASCHPEGRDDGRTWLFQDLGMRRTQTMSGGVMETLPLHWDGDMTNLNDLMHEVFVNRMGGQEQPQDRIDAMAAWMNGVAAVPASAPADVDAVVRGKSLFDSAEVGCASCHVGSHLTSNANADVGTGKAFQVPTLVGIAHRAPFMHDGCAATLEERFTNVACGGGDKHGHTSQLNQAEIADLVAYLNTL